jgi:hypothetical protein
MIDAIVTPPSLKTSGKKSFNFNTSASTFKKFIFSWFFECFILSCVFFAVNEGQYIIARMINASIHGADSGDVANTAYMTLYTSFDLAIPFVKQFMLIYLSTYPF